jgi:hypothetical protein
VLYSFRHASATTWAFFFLNPQFGLVHSGVSRSPAVKQKRRVAFDVAAHEVVAQQTTVRLPGAPDQAAARDGMRGTRVNRLIVDCLAVEIEWVRAAGSLSRSRSFLGPCP